MGNGMCCCGSNKGYPESGFPPPPTLTPRTLKDIDVLTGKEAENIQNSISAAQLLAAKDDFRKVEDAKVAKQQEQEAVRAMQAPIEETEAAKKVAEEARLQSIKRQVPALTKQASAHLEAVLNRGIVQFDEKNHVILLTDHINFPAVKHGEDNTAHFKHEHTAMTKLHDVAEILKIHGNARIAIEGNTATPDDKMDSWAYHLAKNRADLVLQRLMNFGIAKTRMDAIGLPGHLGTNQHQIVFRINSYGGD